MYVEANVLIIIIWLYKISLPQEHKNVKKQIKIK